MKKLFPLIALGAVACAHVLTPEEQAQQFNFHSSAESYSVLATATGLSGAYHSVSIFDGGMRGTVSGRPLDLQLSKDEAKGILGTAQVDLHLVPESQGMRIRGLYAGVLSDVTITPKMLRGQAGPCFYDMVFNGTEYAGNTNCVPQGASQSNVRLPKGYASQSDLKTATALVIMLGHLVDPNANGNMNAPAGYEPGDTNRAGSGRW